MLNTKIWDQTSWQGSRFLHEEITKLLIPFVRAELAFFFCIPHTKQYWSWVKMCGGTLWSLLKSAFIKLLAVLGMIIWLNFATVNCYRTKLKHGFSFTTSHGLGTTAVDGRVISQWRWHHCLLWMCRGYCFVAHNWSNVHNKNCWVIANHVTRPNTRGCTSEGSCPSHQKWVKMWFIHKIEARIYLLV